MKMKHFLTAALVGCMLFSTVVGFANTPNETGLPAATTQAAVDAALPLVYMAASGETNMGADRLIKNTQVLFEGQGYRVSSDINPTLSQLTGNFPGTEREKLNANILCFAGHANNVVMTVNAACTVGLTRGDTYKDFYGLTNINFSETDLVVFAGCESAKLPDAQTGGVNITEQAYNLGAKCSIGWVHKVYGRDMEHWVERFFKEMLKGDTVYEAVVYANSFYYYDERVKDMVVYGDGNLIITEPDDASGLLAD